MTGFAGLTGQRMGHTFISSQTRPIMTSGTVAGLTCHCCVIKGHAQPGDGTVTHIAGRCGDYMGGTFARGHRVVVAVFTQVRGLSMVKGY